MSALARYFAASGRRGGTPRYKGEKWAVGGSDLARSPISDTLIKEGIRVKIGHRIGNIGRDTALVAYNRAIPLNNPEILAAKRFGVPVVPYAELLGDITRQYRTIAISGSHGKSTTTALAGLLLMKAKLDPTILIGTNLRELGGKNMRMGNGPYLVLEADDFGAAFTHYSPTVAIVTNIDREHLDYYGSFANLKRAFLKFLAATRPHGAVILNRDDNVLRSLRARIEKTAATNRVQVAWYSAHGPEEKKIRAALKVPGVHNVSNAAAVLALAKVLGISRGDALRAMSAYRGAWRRMERRGSFRGAPVFDDYAHHPTEIKASLQAFREKYPARKILCVFQPHQAKRLEALFREFTNAFDGADETIVLPAYQVAGRDVPPSAGRGAEALVRAIREKHPRRPIFYLEKPRDLRKAILAAAAPLSRHVIVMMGAGDIVELTDSLVS